MEASGAPRDTLTKGLSGRLRPAKSWDNEGVAATVGTILAVLVFLFFLSTVTNQYVPLAMKDNESNHAAVALEQFGRFKLNVDELILSSLTSGELTSFTAFAPITLSSPGIPVFAAPTSGFLTLTTESLLRPDFNVSYAHSYQGQTFTLNASTGGRSGGDVSLYQPNRYFVEQTVAYENGAIIVRQPDGMAVVAQMGLSVSATGSGASRSIQVSLNQISLLGENRQEAGTGLRGLNAQMAAISGNTYRNSDGTDLTITIRTLYGPAWRAYFLGYLNNSRITGLETGEWSVSALSSVTTQGVTWYTLTLTIENVKVLVHNHAHVNVDIGKVTF